MRHMGFCRPKRLLCYTPNIFTPDAIYLLVVDIMDDIEAAQHSEQFNINSSGEYIDFWLDSIHCFRVDVQDTTAHLCPPVIIVCTGIDKITDIEAKKIEYENKFLKTFGTERKSRHKRGIIHFISNTDFHKEDFENLKQHISEIAKEMKYFTNKLPTKWIQLESALSVLKDVKKQNEEGSCEKLENIEHIAQTISITKDELICFLNYQHKIGNIIFFADKPGYIILQPKWLVDCFRCIMCDDNKKQCIQEDLYELKYRGILSVNMIDNLFSKVPELRFGDYEPHILDVMEKFDIIVKRDLTKSFYLPCMITRSSTPEDIMKECHVENSHCTPWLVFEFTFLPIAYYNHILFSYIRKYTVCIVDELPALYAGKAVVFLDETRFARLIICFSRNTLSLQIWESKPVRDDIYQNIIKELCDKIEELKGELHKLDYKIKVKCSNGDPSISRGRISYEDLTIICKDGEYFCEEHDNSHSKGDIENTWFKHDPCSVSRLGGQPLNQECEELKVKILDQSNQENMLIQTQEEIKDLGQRMDSLRTEHSEVTENLSLLQNSESTLQTPDSTLQTVPSTMTDNLRKLQTEKSKLHNLQALYSTLQTKHSEVTEILKDPVPWNIRGHISEKLEHWSEDDKMFIQTKGATGVLNSIKENGCVVVTGSPGSGKSSTIRHVAIKMQSEGYDILPVSHPKEIIMWYNPNKKILFVVDDFCGTYTINLMKLESWKNLMEKIKTLIEKKSVKLIVSCRLQVYKDKLMKCLSFYQFCECNLLSENMCLSKKEKQSIAKLYLKENASKISEFYDMFDCFPLLCKLNSENTNLSTVDFFKNPFVVYKEELDKLQSEGEHLKYCALALCVVFNNCVKEEWLLEEVDKDIKTIIKNTYKVCRVVKGTPRLVLRDELDSLTHTFIRKDGGVYRAIHEKVFDFLVFYFGTVMIYFLVDNASSQFIRNRFVCEGSIKRDELLIVVPEQYQIIYIKRMVGDWLKGNVEDVYCNINMDDHIFRRRFLVYVKGLDIFEQKQLASSNDRHNNSTPLIQCCYIGDIDLITWCLYHCISNINESRIGGETPLIIACQNGHTEIVQMLINNKADINRSKDNRESPLFIACQNGHTEIVQMLINNKADINRCKDNRESPLFIACQNGHTEIVQILINNKVDINKCSDRGDSPLDIALQKGLHAIIHILRKHDFDTV